MIHNKYVFRAFIIVENLIRFIKSAKFDNFSNVNLSDVVSLAITKNDNHVVPMWSRCFISTKNVKVVFILNITYLFQPQNNNQNNSFYNLGLRLPLNFKKVICLLN